MPLPWVVLQKLNWHFTHLTLQYVLLILGGGGESNQIKIFQLSIKLPKILPRSLANQVDRLKNIDMASTVISKSWLLFPILTPPHFNGPGGLQKVPYHHLHSARDLLPSIQPYPQGPSHPQAPPGPWRSFYPSIYCSTATVHFTACATFLNHRFLFTPGSPSPALSSWQSPS